MNHCDRLVRPLTIPRIPQHRYARLWMALVRGTIAPRTSDVDGWYRAARRRIGVARHEAQLDQLLDAPPPQQKTGERHDAA